MIEEATLYVSGTVEHDGLWYEYEAKLNLLDDRSDTVEHLTYDGPDEEYVEDKALADAYEQARNWRYE